MVFSPSCTVPIAWNTYINCRECKRSIIEAVGLSYLKSARFKLRTGQSLFLSGWFLGTNDISIFCISASSLPCPDSRYTSNSVDADMRIWRHVTQTQLNRILVYSPDTDVYNIGLPLVAENQSKRVIVQVNLPQAASSLYVHWLEQHANSIGSRSWSC